jgi:hypothetical protein
MPVRVVDGIQVGYLEALCSMGEELHEPNNMFSRWEWRLIMPIYLISLGIIVPVLVHASSKSSCLSPGPHPAQVATTAAVRPQASILPAVLDWPHRCILFLPTMLSICQQAI